MPISCTSRTPPVAPMQNAAQCWLVHQHLLHPPLLNPALSQASGSVHSTPAKCLLQGQGNLLACGDVAAAFESPECKHIIEGEARLGGQEHFYLEPQCSVVIPGEHEEFTIISSSQVPHWSIWLQVQ